MLNDSFRIYTDKKEELDLESGCSITFRKGLHKKTLHGTIADIYFAKNRWYIQLACCAVNVYRYTIPLQKICNIQQKEKMLTKRDKIRIEKLGVK